MLIKFSAKFGPFIYVFSGWTSYSGGSSGDSKYLRRLKEFYDIRLHYLRDGL